MHTREVDAAATARAALTDLIADNRFPCVGAKTALATDEIEIVAARHMACPADDARVQRELARFAADYDQDPKLYRSLVVVYDAPEILDEATFEDLLWQRLRGIHAIDRAQFPWDPGVSRDPASPTFSFSVGGHAFYVVGMHPGSSRVARRLAKPAMVFNLHRQFEQLRAEGKYGRMQNLIRRRDIALCGSYNPMLATFGERSEAAQYSGRQVPADWRCPFQTH